MVTAGPYPDPLVFSLSALCALRQVSACFGAKILHLWQSMKGPKPSPYRAEGLEVPGSLISPPASLPSFPGGMGCHPETLSIRSTSG